MLRWHSPPDMERASKVIRRLGLPAESITPEALVAAVWADAAGKVIAAHTRVAKVVRNRLVVEVEDATWQRQLFALTPFVLKNLEKSLGPGLVGEVEFRVMPRRRGPERAVESVPAADEANGIVDPLLRSIYRASRKKAMA